MSTGIELIVAMMCFVVGYGCYKVTKEMNAASAVINRSKELEKLWNSGADKVYFFDDSALAVVNATTMFSSLQSVNVEAGLQTVNEARAVAGLHAIDEPVPEPKEQPIENILVNNRSVKAE